jgi:hypothetical protein
VGLVVENALRRLWQASSIVRLIGGHLMRRCYIPLVVALAVFAISPGARPADDPPPTPSHLVYTVRTDLQKELAPGQANVFVCVDTTEALKDRPIAVSALKLQDLENELQRHKKTNTKLHFNLFCKGTDVDQAQQRSLIRYALIGLGHELGFAKVTAYEHYSNEDITWTDVVASFTGKNIKPDADEPVSENDVLRVFPVRTPLSRFLTSGADCTVVILPSLKKDGGVIPRNVLEAAPGLLNKVKLDQRNRISFHVGYVNEEDRQLLLTNLRRFGEALGFAGSSVTFR